VATVAATTVIEQMGHSENRKTNIKGNETVGMVTFTEMVEKKQKREKKKKKKRKKKKKKKKKK